MFEVVRARMCEVYDRPISHPILSNPQALTAAITELAGNVADVYDENSPIAVATLKLKAWFGESGSGVG